MWASAPTLKWESAYVFAIRLPLLSAACCDLSGASRQLPFQGSLWRMRLQLSLIIPIDDRAVLGDDEGVGVVFADDGA